MKITSRILLIRKKKKVALLLFLTLVVGLTFWWLQSDWKTTGSMLDHRHKQSHAAAQSVLGAEELSIESLQSTRSILEEVAGTSCSTGSLQSWRHYLSDEVSRREESCNQLTNNTRHAAEVTGHLLYYLEDESKLAQIVRDTMVSMDNLEPYQYDNAIEIWQQATSSLESPETRSEGAGELSRQLTTGAATIIDAYKALKEADASNKRPDYDDAYINLQKAYQEFSDVGRAATDLHAVNAEAVISALQKL